MRVQVTIAYEAHATVEVEMDDHVDWGDKELTAAALEVVNPDDWVTVQGWVEKRTTLSGADI